MKPFVVSDSNSRIDQAEQESAAGLGQDSEVMFRELEEDFVREELKISETV